MEHAQRTTISAAAQHATVMRRLQAALAAIDRDGWCRNWFWADGYSITGALYEAQQPGLIAEWHLVHRGQTDLDDLDATGQDAEELLLRAARALYPQAETLEDCNDTHIHDLSAVRGIFAEAITAAAALAGVAAPQIPDGSSPPRTDADALADRAMEATKGSGDRAEIDDVCRSALRMRQALNATLLHMAACPATPITHLADLATNSPQSVQIAVACNPSTPAAVLSELAHTSTDVPVLAEVARHPSTPDEDLPTMVRQAPTSHGSGGAEILSRIAARHNATDSALNAILEHPACRVLTRDAVEVRLRGGTSPTL